MVSNHPAHADSTGECNMCDYWTGFGCGGQGVNHDLLDIVEVMSIRTKQWSSVSRLPQKYSNLSGAVFQDILYMAGGPERSKSVFTCSLPDLWSPMASLSPSCKVWKEIGCLPVDRSSLVNCWLLVGEMTQANPPLTFIDTTPTPTLGPSLLTWRTSDQNVLQSLLLETICLLLGE